MKKLKDIRRKCNFCERNAIVICDFWGEKHIKIAGCEKHKHLALMKQNNISTSEDFRARMLLGFNKFGNL